MTRTSTIAALARAVPRWHPNLTRACRTIACPQEDPCPPTCRRWTTDDKGQPQRCGKRHRDDYDDEGNRIPCREMPQVPACLTCQLAELLPLAESFTDPGDGLRSPNLEGGSRSKGTHSDPTRDTALNHVARSEVSLDRVTGLLSDAEDALRKALSEVAETSLPGGVVTARQHVEDATADLTDALTILHRLLPRATTLSRLTDVGDKGCASHRRIVGPDGRTPWFADTEKPGATLCRTCRRWTDQRKEEWRKLHPGQPDPAADTRRFWPPKGALEQLRDHGHMRASPVQWAAWDRADKPKKGRKAS